MSSVKRHIYRASRVVVVLIVKKSLGTEVFVGLYMPFSLAEEEHAVCSERSEFRK